jgi:hypothetical protein
MVSKAMYRISRCGPTAMALLVATLALSSPAVNAQTASGGSASPNSSLATLALPDDPATLQQQVATQQSLESSSLSNASSANGGANIPAPASSLPEASHTQKFIAAGQATPKLDAGDKVLLGLRDAVAPFSAVGWLASAGYEQLTNGSPNYGTDRGAFGQRLGAAALRDATEGIFTDSILSPVFHEDPRYYQLGPSHNFFLRVVYAGTRPIIGRTDGGRTTVFFASLGGNLAGSALANAYYPPVNRNFTQTMETFGGSLGGSAVGDVVSEFFTDVVHLVHPIRK